MTKVDISNCILTKWHHKSPFQKISMVLYFKSSIVWSTTPNQAGRMSFEGHVNLCCRAWFVLMETSSGRTPSMPWHLETQSSLWTPYSSWPKGWTTFAYPTQKSDFFALLSLLLQVLLAFYFLVKLPSFELEWFMQSFFFKGFKSSKKIDLALYKRSNSFN